MSLSTQAVKKPKIALEVTLVWEQVSRIFTGSSSGGDKASCASYHLLSDGTSVSLQSNLNQPCWLPGNTWGEKENQCWPGSLWFFIRSLSLLINFKICFRDLMSHPLISPRWTCLKVLPLWSAELKKRFKNPVSWIVKHQYFCSISGLVGLKVKILYKTLWINNPKCCCQQVELDITISQSSLCSTSIWSTLQRHSTVRWILMWKGRKCWTGTQVFRKCNPSVTRRETAVKLSVCMWFPAQNVKILYDRRFSKHGVMCVCQEYAHTHTFILKF